jgi:hypothetical protein
MSIDTPHDGNIDVPLQWKWRTTMDDRVCMHYVIDRLEDILEEDTIDASKLIEFKRELIYNLGINQRIAYGEDE